MSRPIPLDERESDVLEFKSREALREPFAIGREVVAMLNAGGGEVWMITYSVPFRRGATAPVSGIVTADLTLAWVRETVGALAVPGPGFGFLVSPSGAFVSHLEGPDGRPTAGAAGVLARLERLRAVGARLVAEGKPLGRVADDPEGPVYLAYGPQGSLGWSLGLVFPERALRALQDFEKKVQTPLIDHLRAATCEALVRITGDKARYRDAAWAELAAIEKGYVQRQAILKAIAYCDAASDADALKTLVRLLRRSGKRPDAECQGALDALGKRLDVPTTIR